MILLVGLMQLRMGLNDQMFVSLQLLRSAGSVLVVGHTVDFDSFACDCGRIFVVLEI